SVEDLLLHLELGDAVPQQPSEPIVALEDRHLVARTRQLLRRRQPGRTRTDDRDLPARRLLRRARLDVTGLPRLRRDRLLDPLDRDRPTGQRRDRQGAPRLARRGTQLARELGEVVRRVEPLTGLGPVAAAHQIVPLGDQIAQRATRPLVVAERDTAVHTAARLRGDLPVPPPPRPPSRHLTPAVHPLGLRPVRRLDTFVLEKPRRISHGQPPVSCGAPTPGRHPWPPLSKLRNPQPRAASMIASSTSRPSARAALVASSTRL